jgi:hypothetical protein
VVISRFRSSCRSERRIGRRVRDTALLRVTSRYLVKVVALSACSYLVSPPAHAADTAQQALKEITDTADRLCGVVATSGRSDSVKVKGDIKASLSGLAKKLADLGISGSGEVNTSSYEGVVQQELAKTLNDVRECKVQVLNILAKMIPNAHSDIEPWRGWLQPANEPTPPNACDRIIPVGKDTMVVIFDDEAGAFIGRSSGGKSTVLSFLGCPVLSMEKSANGLMVDALISDTKGKLIGSIIDNGAEFPRDSNLTIEHSGDLSRLVVHDKSGDELLNVHFINTQAVRVRGVFSCPAANGRFVIINDSEVSAMPGVHRACVANFHTGFAIQ